MSLWGDDTKLSLKVEVEVLRRENTTLRLQIEDLQTQRTQLMEQMKNLQEALVSKTAPQAYVDQKMSNYDKVESGIKERLNTGQFISEYVRELEKPELFDSVQDMVQKLTQVSSVPPAPSIHKNEES